MARMTCNHCQGRGYREDARRTPLAVEAVEVGKVLAYDPGRGLASIALEETVQEGDCLMAICHGMPLHFQAGSLMVAGMRFPMALRGWEVTLLVPQALYPGAWILRIAN